MKHLVKISAISALLIFGSNGWAQRIYEDSLYGTMECVVKDQILLEMKDGVSERYNIVKNHIKPLAKKFGVYPYNQEVVKYP